MRNGIASRLAMVSCLAAMAGCSDSLGGSGGGGRARVIIYSAHVREFAEPNFRVYKVENGKCTQFQSARVPGDMNWHTLRVTMAGRHITCDLDGQKHLEAKNATVFDAGKVGRWSNADARSYFDDLTVAGE